MTLSLSQSVSDNFYYSDLRQHGGAVVVDTCDLSYQKDEETGYDQQKEKTKTQTCTHTKKKTGTESLKVVDKENLSTVLKIDRDGDGDREIESDFVIQ